MVRNVVELNVFKVGWQDLKNNERSIGTLGKSHKPYETSEKMKMAKQATTKSFFSLPIRLEDQYCGDSHLTKKRSRL